MEEEQSKIGVFKTVKKTRKQEVDYHPYQHMFIDNHEVPLHMLEIYGKNNVVRCDETIEFIHSCFDTRISNEDPTTTTPNIEHFSRFVDQMNYEFGL